MLQPAHDSATLRLWEARGGEGQHFPPSGAVFVWVLRLRRGRPLHCGDGGGGARGLRQEEAESGRLLQGTGEGSSHLLHLRHTILPSLGGGVGGGRTVWEDGSRRVRRGGAPAHQWVLVRLTGGLKYLQLRRTKSCWTQTELRLLQSLPQKKSPTAA